MLTTASRYHYASVDIEFLHSALTAEGPIRVGADQEVDLDLAARTAVRSLRIAQSLSIPTPGAIDPLSTPYGCATSQVTFDAPMLSQMFGRPLAFLRGWECFESCVKGFNALGLIAEQVDPVIRRLDADPARALLLATDFLLSRRSPSGSTLFSPEDAEASAPDVDLQDLALWHCFAERPIICSTSTNLGISLHDAFSQMRIEMRRAGQRDYLLFNRDEGRLVVWCPDERADFMNAEKAAMLKFIVDESGGMTTLRTYIDRQQRDPGALREALECGGYFFPTNPQSIHEVRNLLQVALGSEERALEEAVAEAIQSENSRFTLTALGCRLLDEVPAIQLTRGVEGGIFGLIVPYLLLHEELATVEDRRALSVWNQASIGAALAAAVLGDEIIVAGAALDSEVLREFEEVLPHIGAMMREGRSDRPGGSYTEVHGLFDLANIQSLAQLLGVVVNRHLSGRSTAYVGLGSSSYSNGNRCFEILDASDQKGGCFRGRDHFHPATHALNPIAQALTVGEDVARANRAFAAQGDDPDERTAFVKARIRKPEPAGAAALAGYLLALLDEGRLSVFEIAFGLRIAGFDRHRFLRLIEEDDLKATEDEFLRLAAEEGPFMAQIASDLLNLLDWPTGVLKVRAQVQREHRQEQTPERIGSSTDPVLAEEMLTALYITGDNTAQPSETLVEEILVAQAGWRMAQQSKEPDTGC